MSKLYSAWAHLVDPDTGKLKEIGGSGGGSSAPGAKGETGPAGAVGPKGDTGADGAVGPKGDTGAAGADGAVGPKGDTGAAGADGAAGAQGEVGPKGDAGANGVLGFSIVSASFDASAGDSFDWSTDMVSSYGISNVTRIETGLFKIDFETALSSNNYTAVASAGAGNHSSSSRAVSIDERTAESCTIRVERTDTGSQQDEAYIAVIILGL